MIEPDELAAVMNRMWAQFLPQMYDRVAALEEAAAAALHGTLTAAQCGLAHSEAHKLAGILGTFGLPQGTELAREAEALCASQDALDASHATRLTEIAAELRVVLAGRR